MMIQQTEGVRLTPGAARQIAKIRQADGVEGDRLLRIGLKGGGCSGLSYILEFDRPGEHDVRLECEGVELVVDKRHLLYLDGTELDFKEGLDNRGFVFSNPRAKSTCGCGSSFST